MDGAQAFGTGGAALVVCYALGFCLPGTATLTLLPFFVLGAVCAKHFATIRRRLSGLGWAGQCLWLLGSLLLYEFPIASQWGDASHGGLGFLHDQCVGVGALGFILACGSFAWLSALLERPLFQFIGRTSYSFYLVHMVILIAVAPMIFHAAGSYLLAWGVSLLASYAISAAFFRFVEVPGIQCGAWLSRYIAGNRANVSAPNG